MSCSTAGWHKRLEWARSATREFARGGSFSNAITWLIQRHGRRLPSSLRPGTEIMSRLDDDLFAEPLFLMTTCDSAPPWRPRPSSKEPRLFSRIGFESSF